MLRRVGLWRAMRTSFLQADARSHRGSLCGWCPQFWPNASRTGPHEHSEVYQKRLAVCQMPVNVKGIIATYCADQRKVCQEKLCQCMKGKRYFQWSAVADKKQKVQVCPRTMAVTVCQTVSVCVSLKLRLVPRLTLGGSEKRIDG